MASSRQFLNQIRGRYPKRDAEDLITMMNALAVVWAESKRQGGSAKSSAIRRPTKKDYQFAARVFCVLQHPKQPAVLPSQICHLARTYSGISNNHKLYEKFRQSISIGLLTMCKDVDAVLAELAKNSVTGLFRL